MKKESGRLPIDAQILGPFGSPFSRCFDSNATVIVGAGTGISCAESVLREIMSRRLVVERARKAGKPIPKNYPEYVWFVWSCSDVEDLVRSFATIVETVYMACRDRYFMRWIKTICFGIDHCRSNGCKLCMVHYCLSTSRRYDSTIINSSSIK